MDRGRVEEMLTNFILDNNAALVEADRSDKQAYDLVMNAITFISSKYGNGGVSVADVESAKAANAAAKIPDALEGRAEGLPVRDIEEIDYSDIKRGAQAYANEIIFPAQAPKNLVLPTVVLTTAVGGEPQIFYVPLTLTAASTTADTEFILSINLEEIREYLIIVGTPQVVTFARYRKNVISKIQDELFWYINNVLAHAKGNGEFIEATLPENMKYGMLDQLASILQKEFDANSQYYIVEGEVKGAFDMLKKAPATTTDGGAEFVVGDTFRTNDNTSTIYTISRIDTGEKTPTGRIYDKVTVVWGAGGANKTSYSKGEVNDFFRDGTWEKLINAGSEPPAAAAATTTGGGEGFAVGDEFWVDNKRQTYTIKSINDNRVVVGWSTNATGAGQTDYSLSDVNNYFRDYRWKKVINAGSEPPAAAAATKTAPPAAPVSKTAAIKPELLEVYVDRRGSNKGKTYYLQYSELVREKGTKMVKLMVLPATNREEKKFKERYLIELLENGKLENFIKIGDVFDLRSGSGKLWLVTSLHPAAITIQPIINGSVDTTTSVVVELTAGGIANIEKNWVRQKPNTNTGAGGDAQRQSLREQIEALEPLAGYDGEVGIELDRLRKELAAIK
jgi:hypothetical protein